MIIDVLIGLLVNEDGFPVTFSMYLIISTLFSSLFIYVEYPLTKVFTISCLTEILGLD